MGNFQRKAVLGMAAAITAGAAVFMSMGPAHAATAASAAPAAQAVLAITGAGGAGLTAALAWPTVKQGAIGERVFAIQYLLNARGARLATDGHFGPATTAAVQAFQSKSHLSGGRASGAADLVASHHPGQAGKHRSGGVRRSAQPALRVRL